MRAMPKTCAQDEHAFCDAGEGVIKDMRPYITNKKCVLTIAIIVAIYISLV
jgi:hypothetical protein